MKKADKLAYDKDYAAAKKGGKPFFPYAIYKDTIIAGLAILAVIILAITVRVNIGEPVNPATTDFVPRPEWYFYFAFELLKIFKNQNALTPVIMATFMVPNIMIILLVIWPFIDRGPERRIWKRPFALGVAVIVTSMLCYLTFIGATTPEGVAKGEGIPVSGLEGESAAGAALFLANGCTSCHMVKGVGAPGPGPDLTNEGTKGWDNAKMIKWLQAPIAPMPSFASLPPKDLEDLSTFVNGLGTKYK
jgi:ubiquinol-cytochrome c reductase cytochrome b subunit/menaquinol-cytochrome c reductase cytochrome b/c subunit